MDLSFSIAFETEKTELEVLDMLCEFFVHAEKERAYVKIMGNVLKLEDNPDHCAEKAALNGVGWEFYRFDLDGFAVTDVELENQINLVEELKVFFEINKMKFKVLCEFMDE